MDIQGIKTNAMADGSGPHLLFLHGWGVGHELYMPLLQHLKKTHRVFAPDLPGFGKTHEPDFPWGVDEYVKFIEDFIEKYGIVRPVCVGHSNGGRLLLHLLGKGFDADKLVLLNSAGLKPRRGLGWYVRVYTYKTGKLLLSPFPSLKKRFASNRGSEDYKTASPIMKAVMSKLLASDAKPLLPKIKAPALLIWGENDTAVPLDDAKIMEKLIPNAGLAVLEGGHWAFIEQLGRTLRIFDSFLGERK